MESLPRLSGGLGVDLLRKNVQEIYLHTTTFNFVFPGSIPGQVRVRIYADQKPSSAVFTVTQGKYELDIYDGKSLPLTINDPVILALYEGKIAVKTRTSKSFMCDSLIMKGLTGNDRFSFRINGTPQNTQKNTAATFNAVMILALWFL